MKLFDDIKEKEPQTKMILELQKVCDLLKKIELLLLPLLSDYWRQVFGNVSERTAAICASQISGYTRRTNEKL